MKKDKKIFSVTRNINLTEYIKMFKGIPMFYWSMVKNLSIEIIVILLFIEILYKSSLLESIIANTIFIIIIAIIYKINMDSLAKRSYSKFIKQVNIDNPVTTEFYENYLIEKQGLNKVQIMYSSINKIIETDTNIYLCIGMKIVDINKEDCEKDNIDFIRKINTKNYRIKKGKKSNQKQIINKEKISKMLILLFIITILSIFGAMKTLDIFTKNVPYNLEMTKIWVFWFWLPIPILSIILGVKYKSYGIKCQKNIVAGTIIGIFLFVMGLSSFILPSSEIEYKNINKYRDILETSFPKNGILTYLKYDDDLDSYKTDIGITEAFWYNDDTSELENKINSSDKWIKKENISNDIDSLIPFFIKINIKNSKECSFLLYNSDTKEYNKLPEDSGIYNMIIAIYDKDKKELKIGTFSYKLRN